MKSLFNPQQHKADRLYGTTTMGARGQVVIPAQARKDLDIKPGEQLVVLGKFGKVLSLVKSDQLGELISLVMDTVSGTPYEKEVKEHVEKVFGPLEKNKK